MILEVEKATPSSQNDVASRIARRTLAARDAAYADEVRRLLEAGRQAMRECGTSARPRVADIVAAAGLSNDAFYRHFRSKDALVAAILEDGMEQLTSYLVHQMGKEPTPERQVRRWVEGILAQAVEEDVAATTRAVFWNSQSITERPSLASANAPLARLVEEPFTTLGSPDPALDAGLVAHAVVGRLSDHLWAGSRPSRREIDHLVDFVLGAVGAGTPPATP